MTLQDVYEHMTYAPDEIKEQFIKDNFQTVDEIKLLKIITNYFYFEQSNNYINGETLPDDFKVKNFDNKKEEKQNLNELVYMYLKGVKTDVEYLINNADIFNKTDEELQNFINKYKKEIEENIVNNKTINNILDNNTKKFLEHVKKELDNHLYRIKSAIEIDDEFEDNEFIKEEQQETKEKTKQNLKHTGPKLK